MKSKSPIGPVKKGAFTAKVGKPTAAKEKAISSKKVGATITVAGKNKTVTTKLKREAVFAKNAKGWSHKKSK